MTRTPLAIREMLEAAGYVWDVGLKGWRRKGEQPGLIHGRVLDADIACGLTSEQVAAWIKAGEA